MNRNLNLVTGGKRICGTPKVGKLGPEIPTGFTYPALLADDIDIAFPNRRYRVIINSGPGGGATFAVDENSAWVLTVLGDGVYGGSETIEKYDDDVGLVSSENTTYTITVGNVVVADFSASYAIIAMVGQNFPAAYSVAGQIAQDFLAAYDIHTSVAQDFTADYLLGGTAAADFAAAYNVGGAVFADFLAAYAVGDRILNTVITPSGKLPLQGKTLVYLRTRS